MTIFVDIYLKYVYSKHKFNYSEDFAMRSQQTKYSFNEQNAAKISDMKHIAFMNSCEHTADKVMKPFEVSFPSGTFVQPSPYGVTFFHADPKRLDAATALPIEGEVFRNIEKDIPIDLFFITAARTHLEEEDVSEHVMLAKEISPDAAIVILSCNPARTSEMLKKAGLDGQVYDDNILSAGELNRGKSGFLVKTLKKNTGMRDAPYIYDTLSHYSHAALLRDKYYEIESIEKSPVKMIRDTEESLGYDQ